MRITTSLFTLVFWAFAALAPAMAQAPAEPADDAFSETEETRPPPAALPEPEFELSVSVATERANPADVGVFATQATASVAPVVEPEPELQPVVSAGRITAPSAEVIATRPTPVAAPVVEQQPEFEPIVATGKIVTPDTTVTAITTPVIAPIVEQQPEFQPITTSARMAAPEATLIAAQADASVAPNVEVQPEPVIEPTPDLAGPPAAPVPAAAKPEGPLVVPGDTKIPKVPQGFINIAIDNWYCYDSAGGLPQAGELGRIVVLWPCDGTPRQAFFLDNGVLYAGPEKTAQVTIDVKPWYHGCFDRTNYSETRFYTIGACADQAPGQISTEVSLTDPNKAIIRAHIPRTEDPPARGRPVVVAPISAERPAQAQWEYVAARRLMRLIGTNMCITPPFGDKSRGAVLTLDDCDEPMMSLDGAPGPSDGRARVDVLKHKRFGPGR